MILAKVILRHYTHHPWQFFISLLGISLGVAVVVAIDLTNTSASKAFQLSSEALVGNATHQIIGGPDGVSENIYTKLRTQHNTHSIAPIVKGYANLLDNKSSWTFQIVGIDVFSELNFRQHLLNTIKPLDVSRFVAGQNSAVLLQSTAKKLKLNINSEFDLLINGVKRKFTVVGLIQKTNSVQQQALDSILFIDIGIVQDALGMQGQLNHIDLKFNDDDAGDKLRKSIESSLPNDVIMISSASRNYALSQLTSAFQTNLTALSLLALLVGVFLIYNTMTFSVVLRREIIGFLRALGVTRKQIFRLIFIEVLIIGTVATIIGIAMGTLLGNTLLHLVTRTINDLYFVLTVNQLHLSSWSIIKGLLIGLSATAFAGFMPAYEATNSTPRASFTRSILETKYQKAVSSTSWIGYILISIGVTVLLIPESNLSMSFAGLFAILLGFALLIPLLTLALVRMITPFMRSAFGSLGNMSARSVTASLSRTGVAVASLTIAVSTTIGVAVMIDSFRSSVVIWLENSLKADIYIAPAGISSSASNSGISLAWLERINKLPEVRSVIVSRNVQIQTSKGVTRVLGIETPRDDFSSFKLIEGDSKVAQTAFFDQQAVLISEPYSFRHDLHTGDTLTLPTTMGKKDFKIAGVYVDYGSEQGIVAMDRTTYIRYWDDHNISSLGINTKDNINVELFVSTLKAIVQKELDNPYKAIKEQNLTIRSNKTLREASIKVFDRTFAVTHVLRLLAIFVAFVGILSALMAIQLERSRELALLRAIGLTPKQVWFVVNGETGLIGTLSGILAIPLGLILAMVLIYVINRRSFGWTMEISIDPMIIAQSVALAIFAALLAGVYPALRMARIQPADALRED